MKTLFSYSVSCLLCIFSALGQDGTLDDTFGEGGIVTTDFFGFQNLAFNVAEQSGNKIIVNGEIVVQIGEVYNSLIRYLDNGDLDTSFGDNGKAYIFDGFDNSSYRFLKVLDDDKILLTGHSSNNDSNDFLIAKFENDGSLDLSFGQQGKITTDFFSNADYVLDTKFLDNGKIIISGRSRINTDIIMSFAQYLPTGDLDNSFGINGKITHDIVEGYFFNKLFMDIQSDGKVILVYDKLTDSNEKTCGLSRLLPNGEIDLTFGNSGHIEIPSIANSVSPAISIDINDNIIVAIGEGHDNDTYGNVLTRRLTNGQLDLSFGVDGYAEFEDSDFIPREVFHQLNGRILISGLVPGFDTTQYAVTRFYSNGGNDTSFIDIEQSFSGRDTMITEDGKILAGGSTNSPDPDPSIIVMTRYNNNPLSIEDNPANLFVLYPNPSTGIFNLKNAASSFPDTAYQITDISGKTIQNGVINTSETTIDISAAYNGMYFLSLGDSTYKLIKQ